MKNKISTISKYLRLANYLWAAQIYLKDNFLLERKLESSDIKDRLLGHWWTVPGLNFIYANLNRLICETWANMIFVTGPGHWFPAVQWNLFLEWSLSKFYNDIPYNKKWLKKVIRDFSWAYWYPSHLNPWAPWCIVEWGELWYSLSTSFWAVYDNPDLIVACVIWDWEAETAAINAAWHSVKFLNPKTSWAVLPIVHLNWYKISGPTIFSMMTNSEIKSYFKWLWYEALIVESKELESWEAWEKEEADFIWKMINTLDYSHKKIRKIQLKARENGIIKINNAWPVIILKSPKGWTSIKQFDWIKIEWSYVSHQVVLWDCKKNPRQLEKIEKWFKSYKIEELLTTSGIPNSELSSIIPKWNKKMWCNKEANNGITKDLILPNIEDLKINTKKDTKFSSMKKAGEFLKEIIIKNKDNFRLFSPDESYSNKIDKVFDVTNRAYLKKAKKWEKDLSADWRVMEMLSEHTLQWWLEWYLLTWRHWVFVSYEAFIEIVSSMVDQYIKFMHQSKEIPWRKPIASLNYILTSLGWRQDHNWFSHQNPWFISGLLDKHWDYISLYFPADSNSMLACLEEAFWEKDNVNVIIAGKRDLDQYLSLSEAKKQLRIWASTWDFLSDKNPDIVLASAWDYVTWELLEWLKMIRKYLPEVKVRYVNVCKLTAFGIWTEKWALLLKDFEEIFTKDKKVIFSFHWYPNDIRKLLYWKNLHDRFEVHWYEEEWSTTTPLDMMVRNWVSRYHILKNVCLSLQKEKKILKSNTKEIILKIEKRLKFNKKFIIEKGIDPEDLNTL